jgi:hypothetical protein
MAHMKIYLTLIFNIPGLDLQPCLIKNALVIPNRGGIITADWWDIITDPEELEKINSYEEYHFFMVRRLEKRYSKSKKRMHVNALIVNPTL